MSHQDSHAGSVLTNSVDLHRVLQWLISGMDWSSVRLRKDCSWSPKCLVWAALCWAWSNELNLVERFRCAQRLIRHFQGCEPKAATSYQAFTKILRCWTSTLVEVVQAGLRKRMLMLAKEYWRLNGYVVFGVDGSKVDLPRSRSNQRKHACHRKGSKSQNRRRRRNQQLSAIKKAEHPSLFLTTMFHVGSQLPWDWRIGPADSNERAHALEMLSQLPSGSLLTADAGFAGYDFAKSVLRHDVELLIRIGANVRLLKKLGCVRESQGTVYVWPDKAARKKSPPLIFRLVVIQARHPVYLLTSVTSPRDLTDQQVAEMYQQRWRVEVFFRHFKQTFGRRKLRSHAADNAVVELHWSMVGLWAVGIYSVTVLQSRKIPPTKLSIAKALAMFRMFARDYLHPRKRTRTLKRLILTAIKDSYQRRSKTSRGYPSKKRERPPGTPKIKIASPTQRALAARIKRSNKG